MLSDSELLRKRSRCSVISLPRHRLSRIPFLTRRLSLSFEPNARRPLLLLLRALIAFRFLEGKGRALGVRIVVVYWRYEEAFDCCRIRTHGRQGASQETHSRT